MLLSAGKTCFYGPRQNLDSYFTGIGHGIPLYTNPAEHLLDLVNVDFVGNKELAKSHLNTIHSKWTESSSSQALQARITQIATEGQTMDKWSNDIIPSQRPNCVSQTIPMLHRNLIKSHRDIIAYNLRIATYTALAIMMGTVWLSLPYTQESIQPFITLYSSVVLSRRSWPWLLFLPTSKI